MSAAHAYVEGLVPSVHVRDVLRSTAFYEQFGFEVRNTYEVEGRRVWCEPGPIAAGAPGPDRQFRIDDPDGYCVMVTDAALAPPAGRA
jgi:hypothetical protein